MASTENCSSDVFNEYQRIHKLLRLISNKSNIGEYVIIVLFHNFWGYKIINQCYLCMDLK